MCYICKRILMVAFMLSLLIAVMTGSSMANSDDNPFSLWVGPSELGKDHIKVRGYCPENIGASYYSLEIKGYEYGNLAENKEFPPRAIPEFNVQADVMRDYEFTMIAMDNHHSPIATSETIKVSGSQFIGDKVQTTRSQSGNVSRDATSASAGGLEATFHEIQYDTFPYINVFVTVKKNGQPLQNLTAQNFSILENGVVPAEPIKVFAPQTQTGSVTVERMADFAFVFDHSGSMKDDLERLRSAIKNFTDALSKSNINFNLAFIPYESTPDIRQPLTPDLTAFLNTVDSYLSLNPWPGGDTENAFKGIQTTLNSLTWRPGAQKVILVFTDEDDDAGGPTLSELNKFLTGMQTTVYSVVNKSFGHADSDFCNTGSITAATGGKCYDIASPSFNGILDNVTQTMSSKYMLTYKTSDPNRQSGSRKVKMTVDVNNDQVIVEKEYDPAVLNQITITIPLKTLALSLLPQRQDKALDIYAKVTGTGSNRVVSLLFKNGQSPYQSVQMADTGNGLYYAQIPATNVIKPSVSYYVSVTDSLKTVTSPASQAANNPYVISVLPNIPPVITHNPAHSSITAKNVIIEATVGDSTNKVAKVLLRYRKQGTMLYKSLEMNKASTSSPTSQGIGIYKTYIPGAEVQTPAMEYVIYAEDDYGASTTFGTDDDPNIISVSDSPNMGRKYVDIDKIRVWGDQFIPDTCTAGNTVTGKCQVAGSVIIGTVNGNKPLISISSLIEIDPTAKSISSVGNADLSAIQIKRNTQKEPENMPLWSGSFKINTDSLEMNFLNGSSTFKYGVQMLFLTNNKVLISDDKLELSSCYTEISNLGDTDVIDKVSGSISPISISFSSIVLDQTGKNTTGSVKLTLDDILGKAPGDQEGCCTSHGGVSGCAGFKLQCKDGSLSPSCSCVGIGSAYLTALEFEWDFVREAFYAKGDIHFPNQFGLYVSDLGGGFIYSPSVALDRLSFGVGYDKDKSKFSAKPDYVIPPAPPSPVGFTPESLTFEADKLSNGFSNASYTLELSGALRDQYMILEMVKKGFKFEVLKADLAANVGLNENKIELLGTVKLIEILNLYKASAAYEWSGVEAKLTIKGELNMLDILKGETVFSPSITTLCDCGYCLNMDEHGNLRLQFPDYMRDIPKIGKYIAGKGFEAGVYQDISVGNCSPYLLKAELRTDLDVYFTTFGVTFDLNPPFGSINPTAPNFFMKGDYAPRITISGFGKEYHIRRSSRDLRDGNRQVTISQGQKSVLIVINSEKDAALFNITYPDGTTYHPQDCSLDPPSANANKIFFLRNENIHEAYYALNQPVSGSYTLTITNEDKLGNYEINVLGQDSKPEITVTSPVSDIAAKEGDTVTITWTAKPDTAEVCLYYNADNKGVNGKPITCGMSKNLGNTYNWTIPSGIYGPVYIYAKVDDANFMPKFSYSTGKIILPDIARPSVPKNIQVTPGDGMMKVTWDMNNDSEGISAYKIYLTADGATYTFTSLYSPFEMNNLANGKNYQVSITAMNRDGIESNKSDPIQVTPNGTSKEGPPDITIDPNAQITMTQTSKKAQVKIKVKNLSDYPAYAYNVSCYYGAMDESHLMGSKMQSELAAKSETEVSFEWDISGASPCEAKVIYCQVKDVVLEELNKQNNIIVIENKLEILATSISVALHDGWNLISLPYEPANPNISAVFGATLDKVRAIWHYNEGTWQVFNPKQAGFNDLTEIHGSKGYWVYMDSPAQICSSGQKITAIPLKKGWNIIGIPYSDGMTVKDIFSSIEGKYESVWEFTGVADNNWKVYDPATPQSGNLKSLKAGYGYWINAKEACTLTLP